MERLPAPPRRFTIPGRFRTCPAGLELWRIYFQGGSFPTAWNEVRQWGPSGSRFDHHTMPKRTQPRGILYAASGKDAILTVLAEVFQETRLIDRNRNEPWLVGFELAAPVKLLDTSGPWCVSAGGNMAINSGSRHRARSWSRVIYSSYPSAEGIWSPSSLVNLPSVALYERAVHAVPSRPSFHEPLSSPKLAKGLLDYAARLNYMLI